MVLEITKLAKSYVTGDTTSCVLLDVNLSLPSGGTLALEGESGTGKSTVLHLIAGLDTATSGSILLNNKEVVGMSDKQSAHLRRGDVGIIFQQFNLIPSLTVSDNIAFHAKLSGSFDGTWCDHLSEQIGLAEHLSKYPEALSGGQQQRVAIARTLAARPRLILADEPTGNLDENTADRVLEMMLESAAQTHTAILMVTHSQRQAARMERRLQLSHGKLE
ncbi:MAG: ABC transporter ATP-binding protein [Roseobacter sp.]